MKSCYSGITGISLKILYGMGQVSKDSIRKSGARGCSQGRRGPATVSGSESAEVMSLGETLGRRGGTMIWSQENCLIDNRRKELCKQFFVPASDGDGDSANTFVYYKFRPGSEYERTEVYDRSRPLSRLSGKRPVCVQGSGCSRESNAYESMDFTGIAFPGEIFRGIIAHNFSSLLPPSWAAAPRSGSWSLLFSFGQLYKIGELFWKLFALV